MLNKVGSDWRISSGMLRLTVLLIWVGDINLRRLWMPGGLFSMLGSCGIPLRFNCIGTRLLSSGLRLIMTVEGVRRQILLFGTGVVVVSRAKWTSELMSTLQRFPARLASLVGFGCRCTGGSLRVLMLLPGLILSACCVSSLIFWVSLHWLTDDRDLGHFGTSYLEVLILCEQGAGHRLLSEKVTRPHVRAHRPISISCVPSEGIEIRQWCRFIRSLVRALGKLPGGLGGFLPCSVGGHMSRLRHSGWEQCSHGLGCWRTRFCPSAVLRGRWPCCAGRRLVSSSSWTRSLTCPLLCRSSTRWPMSLLCRLGGGPDVQKTVVFRSCSSRTMWTCPLLWTTGVWRCRRFSSCGCERHCDHAVTSWGLANSRGASDSVHRAVWGHSCCATETGTRSADCAASSSGGYGGDEWFFLSF